MKKIDSKGFTLIEILIAISIVSIVVLAFHITITSGIKGNAKNERDIKALNIAQSEIEVVRNQIKQGNINIVNSNKEPLTKAKSNGNRYYKEVDGKEFEVTFYIDQNIDSNIYDLRVIVKSKAKNSNTNYFSKKETELVTQVFGG